MTNRTVKFIGYATENSTVVFNFNGVEVFNGQVVVSGTKESPTELFSFDLDQTVSGEIASSLTVTGNITSVALSANKSMIAQDAYTEDGVSYDAITTSDVDDTFNWFGNGSNNSKSNIIIDGVEYDKGDTTSSSDSGAWHINVVNGTMVCDWTIEASPIAIP